MNDRPVPRFMGLDDPFPDRVTNTVSPVIRRGLDNKRIVGGVDNDVTMSVLGAVHLLWMMGDRRLPTTREIFDRISHIDPDLILKVLKHKRFRTLALGRGIQWPDNWDEALHSGAVLRSQLRPEQVQVMAIVMEPGPDNFQKRLRRAGITAATWMGWLKEPMFQEAVKVSAENMLQASTAAVHASVAHGASNGNVQAQRLFYELTGRHDPAKQQMMEFQNMIGLLLEVITRYITDPVTLSKINGDLDKIISGNRLKELDVIPANYEVVREVTPAAPVGEVTIDSGTEIPDGFFEMEIE